MKVDIRTMEGLLRGKCLPANILVNESLPAYLVRQFDALQERAEAAERERDDLKHIQELNVKIKQAMHERFTRAEAEIARRDAAASEPADRIVDDGCGQQIGGVGVSDQLNCVWPIGTKFYTAAPPAVVSDDALREVIRIWQRSDCPSPEVYSQMRDALGAQPAVLPPEMIADETSMMSEHAAYWYNKGRADTAVLCAQPQKPVFLPADRTDDKSVSTFDSEKFYDAGWNSRGKADKEALDAANVPYEVKK